MGLWSLRYGERFGIRAAAVVLVAVMVGALARHTDVLDRYFIYFPSRELDATPGDAGMEFDDVEFRSSDGVSLHGWFVPGDGDVTMIWFHGNGGNISHRLGNMVEINRRLGLNIFIFDYRGYGKSGGSPTEAGTYMDAEAAIAYVRSRADVDPEKIVYFGRSLGCAVASEAALARRPRALICESGFTSIGAIARSAYPFLPGIQILVTTKYDTLSKIARVSTPVMILHGDRDDIVPFSMGEELFEAASAPKRFYAIRGAGHNDTYLVGGGAYFEAMGAFIEDAMDLEQDGGTDTSTQQRMP